jgi:hypothetical protein
VQVETQSPSPQLLQQLHFFIRSCADAIQQIQTNAFVKPNSLRDAPTPLGVLTLQQLILQTAHSLFLPLTAQSTQLAPVQALPHTETPVIR